MNETAYRNQLQIDLCKAGIRTWRHVVSLLYTRNGDPIKIGIDGQADLWGWVTHNGQAVFLSIETKSLTGRTKPNQLAWAETVRKAGGIAIICRPGDDVIGIIKSQLIDK